jgi:hypothetical protein
LRDKTGLGVLVKIPSASKTFTRVSLIEIWWTFTSPGIELRGKRVDVCVFCPTFYELFTILVCVGLEGCRVTCSDNNFKALILCLLECLVKERVHSTETSLNFLHVENNTHVACVFNCFHTIGFFYFLKTVLGHLSWIGSSTYCEHLELVKFWAAPWCIFNIRIECSFPVSPTCKGSSDVCSFRPSRAWTPAPRLIAN